jgi:hypothetical protein
VPVCLYTRGGVEFFRVLGALKQRIILIYCTVSDHTGIDSKATRQPCSSGMVGGALKCEIWYRYQVFFGVLSLTLECLAISSMSQCIDDRKDSASVPSNNSMCTEISALLGPIPRTLTLIFLDCPPLPVFSYLKCPDNHVRNGGSLRNGRCNPR